MFLDRQVSTSGTIVEEEEAVQIHYFRSRLSVPYRLLLLPSSTRRLVGKEKTRSSASKTRDAVSTWNSCRSKKGDNFKIKVNKWGVGLFLPTAATSGFHFSLFDPPAVRQMESHMTTGTRAWVESRVLGACKRAWSTIIFLAAVTLVASELWQGKERRRTERLTVGSHVGEEM